MKQIGMCPDCKDVFECTNDNKIDVCGYKCPNGHINDDKLNTKFVPLSVDEAQEMVICFEKGETHKYSISVVGRKVGDILRCDECGKVTDVVEYDGLTSRVNSFMICSCEEFVYDDWYESCGGKDCDFHSDLDIEELRKENKEFKEKKDLINEIIQKYPPVNDGILELNRILFMFGNCYCKQNVGDDYIFVYSEFINYCAEHDLLSK